MLRESELRAMLARGPYPARNPSQNLADLRAQIAANEKGAQELALMVEQYGADTVARYMRYVQDNAEECVRRVITALSDGEFTLPLDNGAEIRVAGPSRYRAAQRLHRFHRQQRAAAQQLQCAAGHHRGRGAVRVPHPGRG